MNSKKFPILYQMSSKNKMKRWVIWCEDQGECSFIREEHGYVDGKQTEETIEITQGKNLGKKNATSPFEQACSQAQSKWNKKIDKGYTTDGKAPINNIIFPMLAQSFKDSKHRIKYPCYTQPKLNGIRCVYNEAYQSRLGKNWNTLGHLDGEARALYNKIGFPLDGEIYIHGLNLQDIGALTKKERIDEDVEGYKTEDLEYWIYDYVDTSSVFDTRTNVLLDAFKELGAEEFKIGEVSFLRFGKLVCVATEDAYTEEDLEEYKAIFINAGFEGGMARNNVPYVLCPGNHHCADLQKLKESFDSEYKVIGGKDGVGRDKGCITFRCITDTGLEFDARPTGSLKQRKKWFNDINKIVGSLVTIKYQEKTKDGIPFHGRVIAVRDYE